MATEIKLPNLGDGIDSGEVLELFVSVGDTIEKDQTLLEIETDKATTNVPSEVAGKIVKIDIAEGDTVTIGQVLFHVEVTSSSAPAPAPVQAAKPAPTPAPAPAAPKVVAPATPTIAASTPAPAPAPAKTPTTAQAIAAAVTPIAARPGVDLPASPSIRRFAREVGVDLSSVQGTGPGGRLSREDVLLVVTGGTRSASGSRSTGAAMTAMTAANPAIPVGSNDTDSFGPVTIEKMSRIRKTIANKMHESWVTAPRVTNFDDADVTDLEEFRLSSKDDYAEQGIKLTSMPFVIKAVAMALRHNPAINASVDMEQGNIIYKNYVNIGIAVDTQRGLVVPSLRNADRSSIPDIARQLQMIATNARTNNFGIEDLRGSTFTISNLGAIGGTYSTPIINVPEAAILLLGRTRKLPVVVGDEIKPRLMMPLSLSYDHRLIDGAMAARFLNDIIGYLKAPSRLLLAL